MTTGRHYFFAGGGTGGHIYPGIAVANEIRKIEPDAEITFFCSRRAIDAKILSASGFDFIPLPARGFSLRPKKLILFFALFVQSYEFAKGVIKPVKNDSIFVSVGGFASAPATLASRRLKLPIAMINVDSTPGRANKLFARFANEIFVQFEDTAKCFGRGKAGKTGFASTA